MDFHKKWYSANIMTLVVSSRNSIDQLEFWVNSKFSLIENKEILLPYMGDPAPFP